MTSAITHFTAPTVGTDLSLTFSAFGLGWGYAASKLPRDVMIKALGVKATTREQLLAAFELNWAEIALAAGRHGWSDDGE
ncbi:hypothetical protein DF051_30920 [Burkholderia contaminans]|uniref:Uncharacterized protein n=1 Tax=Burkholderia contaminans TaxID=488447 RepID=A0A3N8QMI4_9BURK|nr:hypothetical protein DF051_30920 [Burkholderia contaminans]